jgi:hypothetical protein
MTFVLANKNGASDMSPRPVLPELAVDVGPGGRCAPKIAGAAEALLLRSKPVCAAKSPRQIEAGKGSFCRREPLVTLSSLILAGQRNRFRAILAHAGVSSLGIDDSKPRG